jgi:branched-chain amino acid transport system permease protein
VILFEVFLNGLLLGGMYGLIALGLNLQYGVARILNLSYGEFFIGGAFTAFFTIMLWKLNPALSPSSACRSRSRSTGSSINT